MLFGGKGVCFSVSGGLSTAVHDAMHACRLAWRPQQLVSTAMQSQQQRQRASGLICCRLSARHAGSYHGLAPTNRRSGSYGILHFTTDKAGKVTDMTTWRAGFTEEREVLVRRSNLFWCAVQQLVGCWQLEQGTTAEDT